MAGTARYATVQQYVDEQPPEAQAMLEAIRAIVADEVSGVIESIRYDMPVFGADGIHLVHAAAWKRHVGLYPVPVFDEPLEAEVAPLRAAKDTVRLLYRDPFPSDIVRRIVREIAARRRSVGLDGSDAS